MIFLQIEDLEFIKFYDNDELVLTIPMKEFISNKALSSLIDSNLRKDYIYDIYFIGKIKTLIKESEDTKKIKVFMNTDEFKEYFL